MNDNGVDTGRRGPVIADTQTAHERLLAQLPGAEPVRLLDEDGDPVTGERAGGYRMPDGELLLAAYRAMSVARRWDIQVTKLTRQGRLATFPSGLGQEAGEIGAVLAVRGTDWLFPTYRDSLALLTRGVAPGEMLPFFRGEWHMSYNPNEHRAAGQATPLATQALHAVGFAHAERLRGRDTVTLAFLGDGAASEGDAHEAMNFAATWSAPTVFFVQNNQYAISVPIERQTASRSIADRAAGLGMRGVWVDGNDAAAVIAVVADAAERARAGEGPSLIEARTYRLEAHTNSDDPTRYRTDAEQDAWRAFDPIARLGAYLRERGLVDDDTEARIAAEAEGLAAQTRDTMNADPELDPLELFDHVYATPRASLREQRAALAAELEQREEGDAERSPAEERAHERTAATASDGRDDEEVAR